MRLDCVCVTCPPADAWSVRVRAYIGVCLCTANLLSDSASRRQAARVRLPEEGPEGGVRKWKAAEFSPGLRCKREAGSLRSARPRKVPSVPHPPVWPTVLCAPPQTGGEDSRSGSARGLEWMPSIDLQPGSAAGELNSRGGQSTEFLFLGVLLEKNHSAKQVCQAQTQMEPHWCELQEFLLPGTHS